MNAQQLQDVIQCALKIYLGSEIVYISTFKAITVERYFGLLVQMKDGTKFQIPIIKGSE